MICFIFPAIVAEYEVSKQPEQVYKQLTICCQAHVVITENKSVVSTTMEVRTHWTEYQAI